nr:uncharacterized protein LOC128704502 [Cherax quadricarinatus]
MTVEDASAATLPRWECCRGANFDRLGVCRCNIDRVRSAVAEIDQLEILVPGSDPSGAGGMPFGSEEATGSGGGGGKCVPPGAGIEGKFEETFVQEASPGWSIISQFCLQTCIEANTDVKTTDGYILRVFCIGFTEKVSSQTRKTAYAQHTQVKNIRKKMVDIITRAVASSELKEVVNKLIPDSMADDIRKACNLIFPLKEVHIRKVRAICPKFVGS